MRTCGGKGGDGGAEESGSGRHGRVAAAARGPANVRSPMVKLQTSEFRNLNMLCSRGQIAPKFYPLQCSSTDSVEKQSIGEIKLC